MQADRWNARCMPGGRSIRLVTALLGLLALVVPTLLMSAPAGAAGAGLTIRRLTWDVAGLDSNTPSSGPSLFPLGVRVCNTGSTSLTGVQTAFAWGSTNPSVDIAGPTTHALADVAA